MWIGIAGQKNGLALICSFATIFLLWSLWKGNYSAKTRTSRATKLVDITMLFLSIYLIMGPRRTFTYSSTSFFALVIGVILMLIFEFRIKKKGHLNSNFILIGLMLIVLIGILMPFTGKIPIKQVPELLGREETLTGRTNIWNALIPYARKRLILGYGFGSFWTTSLRDQINVSAHNGYLETILNLGIAGLLLFILFFISSAVNCSKLASDVCEESVLFLPMIFMFLVHNIAETSMGYITPFPCSLIVLFIIIINKKYYLYHFENKEENR